MRSLFKERVFRKHYQKLIESKQRKPGKSVINQIASVTILAAAKDHSLKELEEAPEYFLRMGLTCHTYVVHEKQDILENLNDFYFINIDDCLWYGVPSQEILIKWLAQKTDLLIVSNPSRNTLIKYLCAASNSKLKSSITNIDVEEDDLEVDLWVDRGGGKITLKDQCIMTYETLSKLGLKPPIIGI